MIEYIQTREELRDYIREKLGYGCINVELTDNQIDHCINDAIAYYTNEADVPNERKILTINVEEGKSTYDIPDTVKSVIGSITPEISGINTLFTIENIMYQAGLLQFRNFEMVDYEIARQYIETIDYLMGNDLQIQFSDVNDEITIRPTPDADGTVFVQVYQITESSPEYFNHPFVKEYSLGAAKVIWGTIGSKYTGAELPAGGQLNLESFKSEGKEQMKNALEELKNKYTAPPRFFMG